MPTHLRRSKLWRMAILPGLWTITPAMAAVTVDFQLMTWPTSSATPQLPAATGRKPSASAPVMGDWLIFTGDDEQLPDTYNPQGALSHNLVDLPGVGGAAFHAAPSLTGTLSLRFE